MIRKVLLILAVVALGIPTAFLTFEHFRGRRRLAATIARLTAQGERLDITTLVPPPTPAASNGVTRLLRVAPRLQQGSLVHPPSMRCIAPGVAAPSARLDTWDFAGRKETTWSAVEEWVARSEADLVELHTALAYPVCRSTPTYTNGFRMLLPHLSPMKSASMALSTSAALATREGDFDGALEDLAAMGRATASMGSEPIVISQLVRIAMVSIALNRGWDILHTQQWTDDQLARLDASLPQDDLLQDMVTALEGERAIGMIGMLQMKGDEIADMLDGYSSAFGTNPTTGFTLPDSLDAATELAGEMASVLAQSVRKRVLMPIWRFAFNDHAIATYLEAMQDFLEATRQTMKRRQMPSPTPGAESEGPILKASNLLDWTQNLYKDTAIPALERVLMKAFTSEIQRTLLRTDIALQRYFVRHGRFPASLDSLVPDFLPAVPVDAADGQPIRYRLSPDRPEPLLWSAGENAIDDGGDASQGGPNASASFFWWRGKDAVWPRTATPTEIAAWMENERTHRERRPAQPNQTNANVFKMSPELMKRYGLIPAPPVAPPASTNPNSPANAAVPEKP